MNNMRRKSFEISKLFVTFSNIRPQFFFLLLLMIQRRKSKRYSINTLAYRIHAIDMETY